MTSGHTPTAVHEDGSPSPSELALERVVAKAGVPDLVDVLARRLSGSDLTTLLLEVMRQRTADVTPAQLFRQYEHDRFVRPAHASPADVRRCFDLLAGSTPPELELVELAPLAPLGTHSVVGTVNQHKVVSTVRGTDVAADPTNALALEAALRRRRVRRDDPRSTELVRLGAFQRVTRAQRFAGARDFAHFALFGMVTAGRDVGDQRFEAAALAEHCRFHAVCIGKAGADTVEVRLTDVTGRYTRVSDAVRRAVEGVATVVDDPDRRSGRGYYDGFCFKVYGIKDGERYELSDGGLVGWTQQLLQSRKERLVISGMGAERLLLFRPASR